MSNSLQSRSRALLLEWLSLALRAVDGRARVSAALAAPDIAAMIGGHRGVVVLAAGKAASRMTLGAYDALGPRILRALVITRAGHADAELRECRNCSVIEAAHPVPDERSLAAGARLTAEVERLAPGELPLLLVSGGASSLVEVLAPGVALEELAALNRELLAAGAAIEAINVRRRKVSLIKGGRPDRTFRRQGGTRAVHFRRAA